MSKIGRRGEAMDTRNEETLSKWAIAKAIVVDLFYCLVLIPMILISMSITYQVLRHPDKIPNVFGYKFFLVFDDNFDNTLKYGDLAITKNTDVSTLKNGDVIAYRNNTDTVSIRRINNIDETAEKVDIMGEEKYKTTKLFSVNTQENELEENKKTNDSKVEGILVNRIPKIGLIIYIIQQPIIMFCLIVMILMIGDLAYMVAYHLDMRDLKELDEITVAL